MKKFVVVCAALIVGSTLHLRAQQGTRGTTPPNQDFGRYRLTSLIESRVVKGAPYSAEFVSESIQTLQDGNRIVLRTTGRIYRDSEGRVRREEDQASGTPTVSISDPVAGKSFTLNAARRTARETRTLGLRDVTPTYTYTFSPGGLLTQGHLLSYLDGFGSHVARPGAAGGVASEEKLADRTIEGVLASGIRRTTTIAAGAIGNERPIKIVSEEWTSPDLQVLVLTDLNDPRAGRSTYKLLKISRAEPDPALFRVPGDYAVERLPR